MQPTAVATPSNTPTAAATNKPDCKLESYFDDDGNKRFRCSK